MKRPESHWALYGQVKMQRLYCPICKRYGLLREGGSWCCGAWIEPCTTNSKVKRMCEVANRRHSPTAKYKKAQLEAQNYRCFYCDRRFGTLVMRNFKPITLQLTWDHIDPFAFSLDNRDCNFVAACHVCNAFKLDITFRSLVDARLQLKEKWEQKGYRDDLPAMSVEIPPETPLAKVL
jgi:hypothetical protein